MVSLRRRQKFTDSDAVCVSAETHSHTHTFIYFVNKTNVCVCVCVSGEEEEKKRNRIWRFTMYSIETCHQLQNADRLLRYFFFVDTNSYITQHNMCVRVSECANHHFIGILNTLGAAAAISVLRYRWWWWCRTHFMPYVCVCVFGIIVVLFVFWAYIHP